MTVVDAASRTFSSLRRHRNYRLWFFGQMTSLTGTWVQNVAFAWYVISVTNSGVATGVLMACQFTPQMLLGMFGGSIADRFNQRKTLIFTQSSSLLVAAAITLISLTGHLSVPIVDAAAALYGLIQVADAPARQAFTMQMVGREELPNAVALNMSLFNTSRALGPGIGGVLIAVAGLTVCFLVNALSFLGVLIALVMMRPHELYAPKRKKTEASGARQVTEGMRYAWHQPDVRLTLGLILVVAMVSMNFQTLLPVLAKKTIHGGPETFGWLTAAFGIGAIIGGLTAALVARPRWPLLLGAGFFYSVALLVLAPQTTVLPAAVALFACGIGFALYGAQSNATVQLSTPDHLRGRVMALYVFFFIGTTPLGSLLAGWLADHSTGLAFGVCGVTGLVAISIGALTKTNYRLPRRRLVITSPDPASSVMRE